jgi:hypothetical protein
MRALLTKRWISALKVTACVLVIMSHQPRREMAGQRLNQLRSILFSAPGPST